MTEVQNSNLWPNEGILQGMQKGFQERLPKGKFYTMIDTKYCLIQLKRKCIKYLSHICKKS